MKTTIPLFILPFLIAAPLPAQSDPQGPGRDLIELFEKMHREGATEDDLRKLLEDRSQQSLIEPGTQHEHEPPQADRPAPEAPAWKIGLLVEPVPPFVREHLGLDKNEGVRVVRVAEGSPAARIGLEVNDIILSAGDKKISNLEELKQMVERAGREGQQLKLGWIHKGERKGAQLRPEGPPQVERERDERDEGAPQRPAMIRRMEEMARRMERQQREIDELRREIERLKRESQADE